MSKKKTLPKTLKQKAVSLFKNEKEEYAYYLKEYKEKYLPEEFNQLELLDELCNDEKVYFSTLDILNVSFSYCIFDTITLL